MSTLMLLVAWFIKNVVSVKHDNMMEIVRGIGINEKTQRIIENLYWNQTVVLRVDKEHTEAVKIVKLVRHECAL